MKGADAIKRLLDGNREYVSYDKHARNTGSERRATLADGQAPYAVVIACSDSRVVPEVIFSSELGELFVVRVAGNVIGEIELASVNYAVEHLGVRAVLVLGHTNCGAVAAAIEGETDGAVGAITARIRKIIGSEHNPITASKLNVRTQVRTLSERLSQCNVIICGGLYDIVSGKVEICE